MNKKAEPLSKGDVIQTWVGIIGIIVTIFFSVHQCSSSEDSDPDNTSQAPPTPTSVQPIPTTTAPFSTTPSTKTNVPPTTATTLTMRSTQENYTITSTPQIDKKPTLQYVSDLKATKGDNQIKTATLADNNGSTQYAHCLRTPNPFKGYTFEYNIPEGWSRFEAKIGIDTNSDSVSQVHFQIYLDDQPIGSGDTVAMWETKPVQTSIAGKHRIKLVTTAVKLGESTPRAVWADARFVN